MIRFHWFALGVCGEKMLKWTFGWPKKSRQFNDSRSALVYFTKNGMNKWMFIKSSCASDFPMLKINFALKTSVSVGWLIIEASQKNFDPFFKQVKHVLWNIFMTHFVIVDQEVFAHKNDGKDEMEKERDVRRPPVRNYLLNGAPEKGGGEERLTQ